MVRSIKFCFVCGKKTAELVDGYCEDCYNKKFKMLKVPEELTVKMCNRCKQIKHKNRWRKIKIEDVLRDKMEIEGRAVDLKIKVDDDITITAKGFLMKNKKSKKEEYKIRLKINKVVCPTCSRSSGGYYEAIVQLRGKTEQAMEFLENQAVKENKNYRADKKRNGFDVYLADKHFANSMSNALIKRFKAKVKKSFRIVTRKEGKDIYRSVIVVRI